MKCLKLNFFFWNKVLLEQAINLSLFLESSLIRDCLHLHESCQHLQVWRDAMSFLEWVNGLNPPPCLCVSPKCSSTAVPKFRSHSHRAAPRHQPGCGTGKGHLNHTKWLLRVLGAIQDVKGLPVPSSNLCGWWDTSQGRFQYTINHQHLERMMAAEIQNYHSLPGNFPSRDDITRN